MKVVNRAFGFGVVQWSNTKIVSAAMNFVCFVLNALIIACKFGQKYSGSVVAISNALCFIITLAT